MFKVGDKVKLKEGLKVDHVYGDGTLFQFIVFDGIKTITGLHLSCFIIDDGNKIFCYTREMLDLVDEMEAKTLFNEQRKD